MDVSKALRFYNGAKKVYRTGKRALYVYDQYHYYNRCILNASKRIESLTDDVIFVSYLVTPSETREDSPIDSGDNDGDLSWDDFRSCPE